MPEHVYVPETKINHVGTNEYSFTSAFSGSDDRIYVSVDPLRFKEGLATVIAGSSNGRHFVCSAFDLPRVEALVKVLTECAEKMRAKLKTEIKE